MGKYKITECVNSSPCCQVQESESNLFKSIQTRESLPLLLQHYYDYLVNSYGTAVSQYIVSLEEEQDNRLNIKLFSNQDVTEDEINNFFVNFDNFIKYEKSEYNKVISVVIEGDATVLAVYGQYTDAKKRALEVKKKMIDKRVQKEIKPTVFKWTGGVSAVLGGAGFVVGGPLGGIFGVAVGVTIGPYIGLSATSQSDLSAHTKQKIAEYTDDECLQERPLLIVIPLRENILVVEQKVGTPMTGTDQIQDSNFVRRKSFS